MKKMPHRIGVYAFQAGAALSGYLESLGPQRFPGVLGLKWTSFPEKRFTTGHFLDLLWEQIRNTFNPC
jgi:hypothetical protein